MVFQNDNMVVHKTHFFTLPHCSILNASMYSIVITNDTVSLDWTEIIQTKVNLEESFSLENFEIQMGGINESENGEAKVQWNHSNQCIKKYMIRLSYNNTLQKEISGEIGLPSPSNMGEKVELDLHMIPGNVLIIRLSGAKYSANKHHDKIRFS